MRLRVLAIATALALVGVTVTAANADAMAGGRPVLSARTAPWMANLAVRGDEPLVERISCGGALIAPDAVLTAAHCLAGLSDEQLRGRLEIHVGATTLSVRPGQVRGVTGADVHPQFRLLTSPAAPDDDAADSATFDVAVVHLDRPVRGVRPLRLDARAVPAGTRATLFGHGITGTDEGVSDTLRSGAYRTGVLRRCATATPAAVDAAAMACAQSARTQACTGDSGGPLVRDGRRGPRLVGVFSFGMETAGKPCGSAGPNFFTSAAAVASWVAHAVG